MIDARGALAPTVREGSFKSGVSTREVAVQVAALRTYMDRPVRGTSPTVSEGSAHVGGGALPNGGASAR